MGKALENKAYEIFLIFGFFLAFWLIFFNKVYVIFFSALPLEPDIQNQLILGYHAANRVWSSGRSMPT